MTRGPLSDVALCAMSHTPLMRIIEPPGGAGGRVADALESARSFVKDFDPDLAVIFGPDHYNGFFYNVMPPFCIGTAATGIGDFGTLAGPLEVDGDTARRLAGRLLDEGVDVALSERQYVDHGFTQGLELLFGSLTTVPVIPVFINAVAEPLCPLRRIRALGEAVGRAVQASGRRVLLIASGGLSHDPPVPRLVDAPPELAERLISGRRLSPKERADRETAVIQAAKDIMANKGTRHPLNPDWDQRVLMILSRGDLEQFDDWDNEWLAGQAGLSGQEIRSWVAAYAAMRVQGQYHVGFSFYEAIPEWIAGFGVTTAQLSPAS